MGKEIILSSVLMFGSGCNPAGNNHREVLIKFGRYPGVEELYFVPTFKPVHKDHGVMASYEIRLESARRLLLDLPYDVQRKVVVSDIERELGGLSHTITTVRKLESKLRREVSIGIGGEYAMGGAFEDWQDHKDLLERGVGVVCGKGMNPMLELMKGMVFVGELNVDVRAVQAREAWKNKEWELLESFVGTSVFAYLRGLDSI